MKMSMTQEYLPFYKALASQTRLEIIQLLCEKDMNVKDLAEALGISSSIMTKHIRQMEEAKIITTNLVKRDNSLQKICTLLNTSYEINVPFHNNRRDKQAKHHTTHLPVGQFTDFSAEPPCGMASKEKVIGDIDNPNHMMSPERMDAQLIWITGGFIEYKLPNHIRDRRKLKEIEISGEFGSEAPGFNDHWPSNIRVILNGRHICTFTTPGDLGERKGMMTPKWWRNSQYGILVVIRIIDDGVYVNGDRKSTIDINEFDTSCSAWTIRFEVEQMSKRGGGMTIFGEKFGNCPQAIIFKQYF